jgi:sentrin-specific protease 1
MYNRFNFNADDTASLVKAETIIQYMTSTPTSVDALKTLGRHIVGRSLDEVRGSLYGQDRHVLAKAVQLESGHQPAPTTSKEDLTQQLQVLWGTNTLATNVGVDIVPRDLRRLLVLSDNDMDMYLNDSVVNAWMTLLQRRHPADLFFGPGVYTVRSTKPRMKRKIRAAQRVFLPVNLHGNHWVLLVAELRTRTITCYDSLKGGTTTAQEEVMDNVSVWLAMLQHQHGGIDLDWTTTVAPDMPQQLNLYDCGVYTCLAADYLANGEAVTAITPDTVQYMRQRIAMRIMQGGLQNELPMDVG